MSEFNFGLGRGKVSTRERARIDRICRKFASRQVAFSNPTLPGDGARFWFSASNLGGSFDSRIANEVMTEVGSVKTIKA